MCMHRICKSFEVEKFCSCSNSLENIHSWTVVLYGQSLLHKLFHWKSFWVTDRSTKLFHLIRFAIYGSYMAKCIYAHSYVYMWLHVYTYIYWLHIICIYLLCSPYYLMQHVCTCICSYTYMYIFLGETTLTASQNSLQLLGVKPFLDYVKGQFCQVLLPVNTITKQGLIGKGYRRTLCT